MRPSTMGSRVCHPWCFSHRSARDSRQPSSATWRHASFEVRREAGHAAGLSLMSVLAALLCAKQPALVRGTQLLRDQRVFRA